MKPHRPTFIKYNPVTSIFDVWNKYGPLAYGGENVALFWLTDQGGMTEGAARRTIRLARTCSLVCVGGLDHERAAMPPPRAWTMPSELTDEQRREEGIAVGLDENLRIVGPNAYGEWT